MAPVKRPPHQRKRTFLREWRQFREMSLEAAAARVGVDHSTLQRIEVGTSPYSQDTLEKLTLVYMCSTTDLLETDPSKKDDLAPLLHQLRDAPPAVQRQAAAVLEAILKTRP